MTRHILQDCCSGMIDLSKVELPTMDIDILDTNLWISAATIVFNPVFWNLVARWEYRTKSLSRAIGDKHIACCCLAVSIFLLGIFRDFRFNATLNTQPVWYTLQQNWILWSGYLCVLFGMVLVFSSFYALGFYGTFLGDYFGILMDKKVTGFPFSVMENPMYWGSALSFFGSSLVKASQTGIMLSIFVCICYKIAILYEGPFTAKIYQDQKGKKAI